MKREENFKGFCTVNLQFCEHCLPIEGEQLVSISPEKSTRQNQFGLDMKTSASLLKFVTSGIRH